MAVRYQNQIHLETSNFIHQDAGFIMGLQDFLPQLVDQMASTSLASDLKPATITYDVITEEDVEKVLKLLKNTFFKDEPLNYSLELGECKDLEIYCTKSIPDRCSFKAVNSDGEIIGVFLNGIVKKPPANAESSSLASKTDHEKFKKIMGLMDLIDSKYDVFELYPDIELFVDGKIWAVDSRYRGHGIAGQLTEKTLEYMRENHIQIYQVLCSSHYSSRVCEKMNFTEVFQLPFHEYVDEDGNQILNPEKPHVAARIFIMKVFP